MKQNDRINTRIDSDLKNAAIKVFDKIGITEGEAIRMFYAQVYLQQGIPFSVSIPNQETIAAMKEGENLPAFHHFSDIKK